jgi:hypothetical protein
MHFYFDGFSDEAILVAGFGGEEFGVLYRTPNSSFPPKPATWIACTGHRTPGNHCYTNSRKRDGRRI